jgi:Flp pilus assembly pilin Flp
MLTKLYVKAATALRSDEGSTGVEYAILVGIIALAVLAGATALQGPIKNAFQAAADGLKF